MMEDAQKFIGTKAVGLNTMPTETVEMTSASETLEKLNKLCAYSEATVNRMENKLQSVMLTAEDRPETNVKEEIRERSSLFQEMIRKIDAIEMHVDIMSDFLDRTDL